MASDNAILTMIRRDQGLAELLWQHCDFIVDRANSPASPRPLRIPVRPVDVEPQSILAVIYPTNRYPRSKCRFIAIAASASSVSSITSMPC